MLNPTRDTFYDLDLGISALGGGKDHKKLVTAKRRYTEAMSGKVDLAIALYRHEVGLRIAGEDQVDFGPQDPEKAAICGALFDSAIMIYVKVATNNDARGELRIEKDGTSNIILAHKRLLTLRNSAIGHFGIYDDPVDGKWHHDRPFIQVSSDGSSKVNAEYVRPNYKKNVIEDLDICLRHAQHSIIDIVNARRADFVSCLNLITNEQWEVISRFPFSFHLGGDKPEVLSAGMAPKTWLVKSKER